MDGSPIVREHRSGTLGRLFEQIDPLDPAQWHREAQRGASAIAVRLVQAQDEPVPIFGPLQAAERERQTVEREEVIDCPLDPSPAAGTAISGEFSANASATTLPAVQSPDGGRDCR